MEAFIGEMQKGGGSTRNTLLAFGASLVFFSALTWVWHYYCRTSSGRRNDSSRVASLDPDSSKTDMEEEEEEEERQKTTSSGGDEVSDNMEELGGEFLSEKVCELYKKGIDLLRKTKYQESMEVLTEAIAICPESNWKAMTMLYDKRAEVFEALKNYQKVFEDCTKALLNDSKHIKVLSRRMNAAKEMGNLEVAFEDACFLCRLEQYKNEYTLLLSECFLNQLSSKNAATKMKTKTPFLPSRMHNKDFIESFFHEPLMDIDTTKTEYSNSSFIKACRQFQNGEFRNIIALCSQELATRNSPFKHELLLLRGTIYVLMGAFDEAMNDLNRLIIDTTASKKVQINALIKETHLLGQRNESEAALALFIKAIRLDFSNSDIYFHRGQHYLYLNSNKEAYRDFQKCIEYSPDFPHCYIYSCLAEYRIKSIERIPQPFKKLRDGFENIFKKFPNFIIAHTKFGQALLSQGYSEEAEKHFRKILELQPNNATALTFLAAMMLNFKSDSEEILRYIKKAISADSKHAYSYELMGTFQVRQSKISDAIKSFVKAIDLTQSTNELCHLYTLLNITVAQQNISKRESGHIAQYSRQI